MFRQMLAAATMLLLGCFAHGQHWSTVPAPTQAPICTQERKRDPITNLPTDELSYSHLSNYVWLYPFQKPSPGGLYAVSNATFDEDGKIGAWSSEVVVQLKSGWNMSGGAWNQQIYEDATGAAWRLRVISIDASDDFPGNPYQPGVSRYFYTGWGGSFVENDIAPYSGYSPYLQLLQEAPWNTFTLEKFPTGGKHTAVMPCPPVAFTQVPNRGCQIAWCRVAERGNETA